MLQKPSNWQILSFPSVASTNDEALKYPDEGTVIWAQEQTAGRGRRNRKWESKAGNLFCSIVVSEQNIPFPAALSFAAALSVFSSIYKLCAPLQPSYKWPNDILINHKKVSGILVEHADNPPRLIIGIGVNLNNYPSESLNYPATSLHNEGFSLKPKDVLPTLLECLQENISILRHYGFTPLKDKLLEICEKNQKNIAVRLANRTLVGVFKSITEQGELVLTDPITGKDIFISAGEIL